MDSCALGITQFLVKPILVAAIKFQRKKYRFEKNNWSLDEWQKVEKDFSKAALLTTHHSLQLKLITHAFYSGNAIDAQFLPDFTDVDINGAVAYNHVVAPNLA